VAAPYRDDRPLARDIERLRDALRSRRAPLLEPPAKSAS
jgi:hypothetical protein